jgi:hypothetical protein
LIRKDEKIKIYYTSVSSPSKEEKGKTIEIWWKFKKFFCYIMIWSYWV